MARCTAVSHARSTIAAAGSPTSSSAPTPWWICERAARSTPGSTESTSDPVTASVSLRKRRSDLCAVSSERRSSSWTHAIELRSSPGPDLGRWSIPISWLSIGRLGEVRRWASGALRRSADLESRHRLLQLLGDARQLAHHLRRRARALAGLLGDREDVLDVGGDDVRRLRFGERLL